MTMITTLLFICLSAAAPDLHSDIIIYEKPVMPYEKLIHAVGMVEGNCDTLAYNPKEKATGYFQIRPIRLLDYNQRTGSNYSLNDMYDFEIAKKIFLYYADSIGVYNMDKIIRKWNGSGPMTYQYLKKVKKYL